MAATKKASSGGAKRSQRAGRSGGSKAGAKEARGSSAYKRAEKAAKKVLKDPKEAAKLSRQAEAKAKNNESQLGEALDDLQTLVRLIRAYAKGEYREVPQRTLITAAAAVVYFVNPIDAIPDVIPVVGYVDDAALLVFVAKAIHKDLDEFRAWEESKKKKPRATSKSRAKSTAKPKSAATKKPRTSTSKKSGSTARRRAPAAGS